jgi:hypothetical protein
MSGLYGFTLSRRDDLESLGYSIMCLIDRDLVPWINTDNKEGILAQKREFAESRNINPKFIGIRDFIV